MKNQQFLISVIVPTYNTPKLYFKTFLHALMNQTYQNLEILIIDDGSQEEYADYYDKIISSYHSEKIKIFHRKNAGVSASRNFGIAQASGEYLLFVDSDDIVGKYYAETLVALVQKYHTAIAKCGFRRFTDENQLSGKDEKPSGKFYYQEKDNIFKGYYSSYLWDKIFHRKIFETFRFSEELTMCEDVLLISKILNENPVCPAVEEPLYFYRINPWSLTENPNTEKCRQAVQVYETVRELPFIKNQPEMLANRTVHCCRWRLRFMMALTEEKPDGWKEQFSAMRRSFIEDMRPIFDYADTKFMRTSLFLLKYSDSLGIVYLSAVSAVNKCRNRLKKIKNKNV